MSSKPGTLYLCATPIGNLEDMSFRAVRVLKEADCIAAEDTRHTRKLLTHFDIHTALLAYHEHNKTSQGPVLIERLAAGETIVVVSDAGMPGISDPGVHLVQLAIAAGLPVVPIPGANAVLPALVGSGLDTTHFTFIGFLPKTKKKRHELLTYLAAQPFTLVFYESPHRLKAMLAELHQLLGDRQAAAARELTKKFEEFVHSTLGGLMTHFDMNQPRGEFTIVVAGNSQSLGEQAQENSSGSVGESPVDAVQRLIADGTNKKDAIRMVASEKGLSRRDVYQAVISAGI